MRSPLLLLIGLLTAPTAAWAQAQQVLDDQALQSVRGGYVSAGGLSFDFAAEMRTFVDNKLVLQSHLSLSDTGLSAEQTGLPAGADSFVSIPGEGGATKVMQLLDAGRLGNVVLNTASNQDIRQDTAVTLVVPGLAELQDQIGLQRLGSQLNAAAASPTIIRLGR